MRITAVLASGLAGWLTYEHMRRKVNHHEEHTLYSPITEIAETNGFVVKREFPLPRVEGQRGSPREVDFLLISEKRKECVVLEVKFKKTAKAMAGGIGKDALKIRDVTGEDINKSIDEKHIAIPRYGKGYKIIRAVLLVWQEGDILSGLSKNEPLIIRKQIIWLLKHMLPEGKHSTSEMMSRGVLGIVPVKPVDMVAGHIRFGSTRTTKRYWVAVLVNVKGWQKIGV